MSSLARRSLRTTAAAAGLAAISVGIAAPAFATPDAGPAADGSDSTMAPAPAPVPAAPLAGLLGKLPGLPSNISELPQLFTFKGPTLNTASPDLPGATDATSAVADPAADAPTGRHALLPAPVEKVADGITGQVNAPVPDPMQLAQKNGLVDPNLTKAVQGLAGKAMAGDPLKGNSLG